MATRTHVITQSQKSKNYKWDSNFYSMTHTLMRDTPAKALPSWSSFD